MARTSKKTIKSMYQNFLYIIIVYCIKQQLKTCGSFFIVQFPYLRSNHNRYDYSGYQGILVSISLYQGILVYISRFNLF